MAAPSDAFLQMRQEADGLLIISTGDRTLRRQRLGARFAGIGVMAAGLAALWLTPWAWVVAAFGAAAVLLLPGRVQRARLLGVDMDAGSIQPYTVSGALAVSTAGLQSVKGRYETQGWDGRSVVFVVDEQGMEKPVLVLPGTDETLAEAACELLGRLLSLPATYSGPFGSTTIRYDPDNEMG